MPKLRMEKRSVTGTFLEKIILPNLLDVEFKGEYTS